MEPNFWTERWTKGEIGFHQKAVNDLLVKYWGGLGLPKCSGVLVPLAGKSLDMAWLASQGHRVIGSELSELAVDAFLSGEGLAPAESYAGPFIVKRAAPYELWVGDFFALASEPFRDVAAVYDRAALIAMPLTLQAPYVAKLAELVRAGTLVLLITIEYDPSEMSGPPFSIPEVEVSRLCQGRFDVAVLERRDGMPRSENLKARGLSRLSEVAYMLRRKST